MRSSRLDGTGLALAAAAVLAVYWPAVSGQGYFFERDVWLYWVPHIEWAARTLAAGRLPQWNPFAGFGAPFMADPSFQFFYPPAILNWVVSSGAAYSLLVAGHAIMGSTGVFLLLRRRLHSRAAALVAACVFVASGPLVSSANLWHHFSSAMYMPWVLDAFLRVRAGRGSFRRLGFFTGLQALAGSADVCVMTGASLVFLLPRRARRLRALAPRLAGALIVCLLLAAVQWIPTALLARDAARAALDSTTRLHWSVSPVSLIDFVLPLSGAAHAVSGEPSFMEERVRFIPWMYFGASTLPLIVLGALRAPRAALFLVLAIVLSLGRHGPIAVWLSQLPIVSMFRFPSKILWLVSLCWAILAAVGFRELARRSEGPDRRGLAVGLSMLVLALGLFLLNPAALSDNEDFQRIGRGLPWAPLAVGAVVVAASLGKRFASAVALVVAVDVIGASSTFNTYAGAEMFRTRPTVVDSLSGEKARRIFVVQASRNQSRIWKVPPGWTEEEAFYFGQGQFLLPPQSVRWSIRGSFDGDFTGLARPDYANLSSLVFRGDVMRPLTLRLAGVTHVLRFQGPLPLEFPLAASVPTFHDRPVLVLRVPDPLPLAYVVHEERRAPTLQAALDALGDPSFDPARAVVRIASGGQGVAGVDPSTTPESSVSLVQESEGGTILNARLKQPGTLVVLNAFSRGWSARVDGKKAEVRPANLVFQSVDLDAGEHRVELEYQTPGLRAGLALSLLAWAWLGFKLTGPRLAKKA